MALLRMLTVYGAALLFCLFLSLSLLVSDMFRVASGAPWFQGIRGLYGDSCFERGPASVERTPAQDGNEEKRTAQQSAPLPAEK